MIRVSHLFSSLKEPLTNNVRFSNALRLVACAKSAASVALDVSRTARRRRSGCDLVNQPQNSPKRSSVPSSTGICSPWSSAIVRTNGGAL